MKKALLIWLFSLLLIQVSCNSGSTLEGQVLDPQNNPVEGAEVKFVSIGADGSPSQPKPTEKTGKSGEFKFNIGPEETGKILGLTVKKDALPDGYKIYIG